MKDVHWFPGHMARAKKLISENLKKIDVVIEVLDARAPRASGNPLLKTLCASKPRLKLLNKDDLADPKATLLWADDFTSQEDVLPLRVSASSGKGIDVIPRSCRYLCTKQKLRRPVRALIVGIPNVGKSTIINTLSGKRKAEAAATPGLTRELRRIPVSGKIELFDTPGLLWHKFENSTTGIILAALGAVKESILPVEEVSGRVLLYLARIYPDRLQNCYRIDELADSEHELLDSVGRSRGCLAQGAQVDVMRTCQMLLKDLREGRLGPISLEWPHRRGWD